MFSKKSLKTFRFSENREPAGEMTSVDVKYKTIEVNKKQVKLDLWDTGMLYHVPDTKLTKKIGGQEKFRTLTGIFFVCFCLFV